MRITLVTEDEDLRRLFAFRYRVYVEELGWLPQGHDDAPPAGVRFDGGQALLTDEFDAAAYNYAAFDDAGEVVGSIRVVADGPLGLPLQKCTPLDGYGQGKRLVEVCRLAVGPEQRGTRLTALLMKAGFQRAALLDATHLVLDAYIDRRRKTHALYFRIGFKALAAPRLDPDYEWRLPVQALGLDCAATEAEWATTRPQLMAFFTSDDPTIDHGPMTPETLRPGIAAQPADLDTRLYSRLVSRNEPLIDEAAQTSLRRLRLAFLGCGLASQVAVACARLGCTDFSLWDGDAVEPSNLNRQAFRAAHVGRNKAAVTQELITEINPDCHVQTFPRRLRNDDLDELLSCTDVLVNSADFDDVVYAATDMAAARGVFSIQPLNLGFGGSCMVFGRGSARLEDMTNGRQQSDGAFLMNLAGSAQGLRLSDEFVGAIPALLSEASTRGYFAQNAISSGFTVALVCYAILRIAAGKTDGLLAPRVLNFDPMMLSQQT